MSLLVSCQNISKSYGGRQLFFDLSFGIFDKNRIGLIGPNGSGKSTLMKLIANIHTPDEGIIAKGRSTRIGYVPQETRFADLALEKILIAALKEHPLMDEDEKAIQAKITLSKLGFTDFQQSAQSLSGGWQKRLAIAVELVQEPDLLLFDEPTNHLDLEGVIWLENFLKQASFAYMVISHDRYFLEHVAKKMMELNKSYPKGLFTVEGPYSLFIEKREEFLSGQLQQERSLASKVRREVEWLKQNPKARTTKSQSRIQEAHRLIGELQSIQTRNKEEKSTIDFSSSKRESQKLLVATNLSKTMGEKTLFSNVSFTLSPGVRLGIVGLNGSGKTTLLRLLKGEISPDKGTIKYADGLQIVYFDQHRAQLEPGISLRRALAPEGDTVYYRGQAIHVNSWCRRFLFSQERLDLPFGQLSGGEKARVHIARLMLQPADILLLDEPTNDLDLQTLDVLEASLQEFPGAIVLISHDRYMLDQLSTLLLGLGTNSDSSLFADYLQWEEHRNEQEKEKTTTKEKKEKNEEALPATKKMGYMEKRELQQMEGKIILLEAEIEALQRLVEAAQPDELQELCQKLNVKHKELDCLFLRWEELESKLF